MQNKPGDNSERKLFYFAACLILSSLLLMGQFARTVRSAEGDQFYEFTGMFAEIHKEVRDRYVEPVDSKKLFEGALQGMFLTLDPHSQYMEPDSYNQLEKDTEGAFSGIGIQITIKDNVLTVIAPIPGSPAALAGVQPWDRIIEIEGKKTEGITTIEAVKKLTGPSGTTVKITVYREGETEPLHFELVRKNIKVESVYQKMLENNVGYIRLVKFSDNTARDMRKAIETLQEKGAKGLIVDLRFNSGGLLKEAIDVSNLFVPKGKVIVSTKGRQKAQNQEFKAENDPVTDLPLLVLINRSSASASEILAGAIKDLGRGMVVGIKGQRSFGKGSVQTIEELNHSFEKDENGNYRPAAIRLTTAKYYTPSGISIDKIGITPDIAVEIPKDNDADVYRFGLLGEPDTEEEDSDTSKSTFTWKNGENGTTTPVSAAPEENGEDTVGLAGSAVIDKNDKDTTGPEAKKIVSIDRTLFPNDEIEGEPKKPNGTLQEKKKKFIDYQLLAAERLMRDHLEKGRDFLAPDAGTPPPPNTASTVAKAAEPKNEQAKQ